MTKYNLEEFKIWVEAKGNEIKDCTWSNYWSYFPNNLNHWETILQGEGKLPYSTIQEPVQNIILQWKAEIDQKKDTAKTQNQLKKIFDIISPNSPCNFQILQEEIKRLKIQDLTIQIPLKKQELEQLTNNIKNNLNNSGKYLLEKLLKKQKKDLQNNETSDKLEELKQTLSEDLNNQESLQSLLDKQKELFNLEKHLENLQTEQVAQIIQN